MISIQAEAHFAFESPEYRALYECSDATLFQHPVWLDHMCTSLAPAVGAESLVITGRTASSGELRFVLPLMRVRDRFVRRVEFADLGVSDYAAPVIDPAANGALASAQTTRAIRAAIGDTDLVRIDKIMAEPAMPAGLLGSRSIREHDYETHRIVLNDTFDAWRKTLPAKFVRHLNDKRKRLSRNRRVVELHELTSADDVDAAFDKMREFRQARFADRRAIDLVQDERYFGFYRDVARFSAIEDDGPGSTTVLTVNGDIVAASFCLQDDDQDVFLLIGYDVVRYRNYALGLLLVEDLIAASFANGKRIHDLTLGHDNYKKSFGAEPTPMYSVRAPVTVRGRAAQRAADQNAAARLVAKRMLAYQQRRFPKLEPVAAALHLRR